MTAQGLRTKTNMVSRQKEIASTIANNKTLLASMLHNTLKSFLVQLIGLDQFKFAIRILFTSLSSDVIYRFLFFIGCKYGKGLIYWLYCLAFLNHRSVNLVSCFFRSFRGYSWFSPVVTAAIFCPEPTTWSP